jgi:hypothetical protein
MSEDDTMSIGAEPTVCLSLPDQGLEGVAKGSATPSSDPQSDQSPAPDRRQRAWATRRRRMTMSDAEYLADVKASRAATAREVARNWRLAHPDEARERGRKSAQKWRAENPEKARAHQRDYYRRLGAAAPS